MLSSISRRPVCLHCQTTKIIQSQQTRNATLIKRPKRPYTFTQLITMSDGSTFLHRTTSPAPIYQTSKDTKNTALWNPSSQKLLNIEEDEAGRLRKFRSRFGRGWDAEASAEESEDGEESFSGDSLLDLMTASANEANTKAKDKKAEPAKDDKTK